MLESAPDIEVVGLAESGEEVLDLVERLEPDVLTMDINLPGRSGISIIDELMADHPLPILVISDLGDQSEVAIEALGCGAVEVTTKPEMRDEADFEIAAKEIAQLIRIVAKAKVIRHLRGRLGSLEEKQKSSAISPGDSAPVGARGGAPATISAARNSLDLLRTSLPPAPTHGQAVELIAIAASTGGPQALEEILSGLPDEYGVPIVIVQHIATGFTAGLTEWLSGSVKLDVKLAEDGEEMKPGSVLIAPEGRHMKVRNGRVALEGSNPVGGHCPSADVLFESVAAAYGESAVAVILTGMGRDGAVGLKAVHDAGGVTLVQDEASCAVFGMPKAAIDIGAAGRSLPPADIARALARGADRVG